VAVASAGPYANLHLDPDTLPSRHPTTQFFTGLMPFLPPNQQRQSTEGSGRVGKNVAKVAAVIQNKFNLMSEYILPSVLYAVGWVVGRASGL